MGHNFKTKQFPDTVILKWKLSGCLPLNLDPVASNFVRHPKFKTRRRERGKSAFHEGNVKNCEEQTVALSFMRNTLPEKVVAAADTYLQTGARNSFVLSSFTAGWLALCPFKNDIVADRGVRGLLYFTGRFLRST
jgi:hypothetical protein